MSYKHLVQPSKILALLVLLLLVCAIAVQVSQKPKLVSLISTTVSLVPRTHDTHLALLDLAFSHDGKLLASAGINSKQLLEVDIIDVQSLRLMRSRSFQGAADCVVFAPDLKKIVISQDRSRHKIHLQMYDTTTGKLLWTHNRDVNSDFYVGAMAFSPRGDVLATSERTPVGYHGSLAIWEVHARHVKETTFRDNFEWELPISCLAFTPDGSKVVFGSEEGIIAVCSTRSSETLSVGQTNKREDRSAAVQEVAFSSNGKLIASAHADNTCWIWDAQTGKPVHTLRGHSKAVLATAFSPDGRILASGSDDGHVKLWNVQTGQEVQTLKALKGQINSVIFSPDGSMLAAGSKKGTIALFRIK